MNKIKENIENEKICIIGDFNVRKNCQDIKKYEETKIKLK